MRNNIKNIDFALVIAVILITLFGLVMIYSSSMIWAEYKFNDPLKFVKAQGLFLIVGLISMIIISKIPYTLYKTKANLILGVCFLLLILVLIPGIGTIRNGSRSWFGIGSLGIQPSEFMKLALMIFTSKYVVKNKKDLKNVVKGVLPIFAITMFAFVLIMLQPDFGTGFIIVVSIVGLLYASGANLKFFFQLGLIGTIGIVGLIIAAPYRLARILSFLNPWSDPLGSGFQIIQSLYAIGPGELCKR